MHAIEQQIYASLAIDGLKAGHHTHASTGGLSQSATERHESLCNRWGEYEPGVDFNRALIHVPLWLDDDPPAEPSHYMTALITYQGRDASGRPGAVLRHIVRSPAERCQGLDFHPFHLMRGGKLLESWEPTTPFPVLEPLSDPTKEQDLRAIFPERYPLLRSLLGQLLANGKLHIPAGSDSPAAEETLSQVLELVPLKVRRLLSVASFAQRNARDYHLAVVRQDDTSFRQSLESQPADDPSNLDPVHGAYLQDLFSALDQKEWNQASELIHRANLPWPDAVLHASTQTNVQPEPTPEAPAPQRREVPPEMPYRRREEPKRRSRLPLWLGLGAGALVILAVVLWSSRRPESSTMAPSSFTSLSQVEGGTLPSLLSNYRAAVAALLTEGADDFQLQQSLHSLEPELTAGLSTALTGSEQEVDQALLAAAQTTGVAGESVGLALQEQADLVAAQLGELSGFHRLVRTDDVAGLREAFDPTAQTIRFPAQELDVDPDFGAAGEYVAALRAAATLIPELVSSAENRDAAAWSTLAETMTAAGLQQSTQLRTWPRVAAAMAQLIPAEGNLSSLAHRTPYDASSLDGGELGAAQRELLVAADAWPGAAWPGSLGQSIQFYRTWRAVAPAWHNDGAAEALKTVATLCDHPAAPCEFDGYAAQVGRWRVELWRSLGGSTSAAAASVIETTANALPAGGAAGLAQILDTLQLLESTSLPAPPATAAAVRQARQGIRDATTRSIIDAWLARSERGSQGEQNRFDQAYRQLQSALADFRAADDASGASRYQALRKSLARANRIDLRQVDGSLVAGVQALEQALLAEHSVELGSVSVQLHGQNDYSGTAQSVATVEVRIFREQESEPAMAIGFSPMLWAAAAGFSAGSTSVADGVQLRPDRDLVVVGHDSRTGGTWFHFHVAGPAEGHVAANLAGIHVVSIDPELAASAGGPGNWPRLDGTGTQVATVTIDLRPGWWSDYASSLPDLP